MTNRDATSHIKTLVAILLIISCCIPLTRSQETSSQDVVPSSYLDSLYGCLKKHQVYISSIVAALFIGLSGVFPLLVIPIESGAALKSGGAAKTLQLLLSFAVGSLLGDVFLHLLPESWNRMQGSVQDPNITIGLWVLVGIFSFVVVEKLFEQGIKENNNTIHEDTSTTAHIIKGTNGYSKDLKNRFTQNGTVHSSKSQMETSHKNVAGYLNLLANGIDNFSHGLAVAASFLVNFKVGVLTTFAILIHEVPHEIGDFAILLKSGFNRWEAAKAQMATATIGILGAMAALSAESTSEMGAKTCWILPFTAGGFLNIALVTVLPDLLKEDDPRESIKQLGCMILGVSVMVVMTTII